MYAIIRAGDKQFRAEPGATLRVPALNAQAGDIVTFDDVLLTSTDDGVRVGNPTVTGASVTAEVVGHGKDRKITVFKWKRRKNYRRKQGHRQKRTDVRIEEIRLVARQRGNDDAEPDEARAEQGATREHSPSYVTEEQRSSA